MNINGQPNPNGKVIALVSGGIDSAVTLALAVENFGKHNVLALRFDYRQKHAVELDYSKKLTQHYEVSNYLLNTPALSYVPGLRASDDTKPGLAEDIGLLPKTWKPGRNIIFLTYAGIYACTMGYNFVAIGAHQEDYPGYPDCRTMFLGAMENALNFGLAHPLKIWAPLLNMSKAAIVRLGLELKVPFEHTWSCYKGEEKPCGECDACIRRADAFNLNGRADPWIPLEEAR